MCELSILYHYSHNIYIYEKKKKKKTQCQHVCRLLSAKTQIKVTIQQSMKERAFDSTHEKSHYKLGYNKRILIVALHFRKTIDNEIKFCMDAM